MGGEGRSLKTDGNTGPVLLELQGGLGEDDPGSDPRGFTYDCVEGGKPNPRVVATRVFRAFRVINDPRKQKVAAYMESLLLEKGQVFSQRECDMVVHVLEPMFERGTVPALHLDAFIAKSGDELLVYFENHFSGTQLAQVIMNRIVRYGHHADADYVRELTRITELCQVLSMLLVRMGDVKKLNHKGP